MLAMSSKQQAALVYSRAAGAPPALLHDLSASLACGAGYAAMHALMAYGALLGTAATVDAAFYWDACPSLSAYVISAVTACLASVLHMALQVVATDAWRALAAQRAKRAAAGAPAASHGLTGALGGRGPLLAALPAVLHVCFSQATLLSSSPACVAVLPVLAAITAAAVGAAVWAVRQPGYVARRQARGETAMLARRSASDEGGAGAGWAPLPPTPAASVSPDERPEPGRGVATNIYAGGSGPVRNPAHAGATVARRTGSNVNGASVPAPAATRIT